MDEGQSWTKYLRHTLEISGKIAKGKVQYRVFSFFTRINKTFILGGGLVTAL